MLLHQKVTYFNAYLTYRRLKVLFSAQKTRLIYMNQLRYHSSGCKFKIYTQFYTQKLRYGKIFCDILILG